MIKTRKKICDAFGKRVQELRIKSNMTQREFADAAGIHVSFVSAVERGLRAPRLDIVVNMAKALNVRVGELFSDYEPWSKEIVEFIDWLNKHPGFSVEEMLKRISKTE